MKLIKFFVFLGIGAALSNTSQAMCTASTTGLVGHSSLCKGAGGNSTTWTTVTANCQTASRTVCNYSTPTTSGPNPKKK